uniref:NBS-LRR disease resistance protein n=1 Tax=Dasypyrum villosum TaxID=40247 RepID=A0A8K1IB74_9POAL|nr:NBS-LRR disease resistance protein [Dasypyrum villosum]
MEAALVSAATGALKPVLAKLGVLAGDEYKRFKGVREDIKSLKRELTAIDAFLLKMSEEEDPDVQDKVWMNEIRELSYDMEDSINDFMQSVNDGDTKPDGFLEKMNKSLGKMKARRRIGNEIEDLKKQIIELAERNARYKAREAFSKAKNTTVDPRALAIFQHASELVGIDEPKAEVIKLLTEGASTQEQMKLVTIVGSGGMGKTTLANQVYQDLKGEFKCRSFLSVSRNPDIMNIMRTIFSEVSGQRYADTEAGSIQQLISKIVDFLADKRYFVVVDDIWTWIHGIGPWKQVEDSIGRALQRNPSVEGMMKILSLSYFELPAHLKSCLLCLGIFPEDSVIKKKGLINRWIAERLIHTEAGYIKTYEFGESPRGLVLSHVRSLDVFGESVEIPSMDKFRYLRFLDFNCCKQLENHHLENIGRLFQLRYLSLYGVKKVSKLSEQIGCLLCLEILELRRTSVYELPASIVNLKRLVHLFVNCEVTLPCGVSKLQGLEKLKLVSVYSQSFNFLQEFEQMQSLKAVTLNFKDYSSANEEPSLSNCLDGPEFVGESLCPMPLSLRKLEFWCSRIPHVPKWVGSLVNLQELCLELAGAEQKDFYILGGLPVLRCLILDIYDSEIRNTPSTEEPEVTRVIYAVMNLTFAAGAMPNVDDLSIEFNAAKTESLGTSGDFDLGIENLPSLLKIRCKVWGYEDDRSRVEAAIQEAANAHPNRLLYPSSVINVLPESRRGAGGWRLAKGVERKLPMVIAWGRARRAGQTKSPNNVSDRSQDLLTAVRLPSSIRRMAQLETLSHVDASHSVNDSTLHELEACKLKPFVAPPSVPPNRSRLGWIPLLRELAKSE